MLEEAVAIYRSRFKPGAALAAPYVIVGVNAILADTDAEAQHLATTQTQFFLNVVTNAQQNLQPPVEKEENIWTQRAQTQSGIHFGPVELHPGSIVAQERAVVAQMTACSLIGTPQNVATQLADLRRRAPCEEIMAVSYIYDETKQMHSYSLLKKVIDSMA